MVDITLIVEDVAQEKFIAVLVRRLASDAGVEIRLTVKSARFGFPEVLGQVEDAATKWMNGRLPLPHGIIIGADCNCRGAIERRKQITGKAVLFQTQTVLALPDPHIERWFLLDSRAFAKVFGAGCKSPDSKCDKDRYKKLLREAIRAADVEPLLGGYEYAEALAEEVDLNRASRDPSFGAFVSEFRNLLRRISS